MDFVFIFTAHIAIFEILLCILAWSLKDKTTLLSWCILFIILWFSAYTLDKYI